MLSAGCLPSLATIPIFIGLYNSLTNVANSGRLDSQGFFWLPSLAGPTSLAARQAGQSSLEVCVYVDTLNLPGCWCMLYMLNFQCCLDLGHLHMLKPYTHVVCMLSISCYLFPLLYLLRQHAMSSALVYYEELALQHSRFFCSNSQ